MEYERSASRPESFTSREITLSIHWIGGWVGPRTVLTRLWREKFPAPAGTRTPNHRGRSSVAIPLSYPGLLINTFKQSKTSSYRKSNSSGQFSVSGSFSLTQYYRLLEWRTTAHILCIYGPNHNPQVHNTLSLWHTLSYCLLLSGIALGYGLDDRGFESRQRLGIFLFTSASRPALGPTQPPIRWVTVASSLGVKRPGRKADHSPPPSAEAKNAWSYTSTLSYPFMAWCSVKAQGQLYL
jgi:hypothetical protein